jgi:hypothetical protein
VPVGGDAGTTGGERPIDMGGAPTSPRKVTFNNANVTTDLRNFPVLIPVAGQVDYSLIVDPRKDLRFEDPADGATLPYEVETWTPNGESLVWVEVPKISPFPAPASILMYFGPDASTAAPAAVWSTYEQVNHFAANPDDSTMQRHDATAVVGATTAAGFLGNAMTFSTDTDRVVFAGQVFDAWKEGTIEMWIRPIYAQTGDVVGEPKVLTNGGALQLGRFYIDGTSALVLQIDAKFAGNTHSEIHPDLPFNTWTHLAWTFDGMVWRTFRNGQLAQMDMIGNHDFVASPMSLVLGDDGGGNGARMQVDELRIGQKKRSADWLRAQHASMTRNFVSFSDP